MTNFSMPFSLTATGQVSTTQDPNQIGGDRMESLVGTYPGERVMLSDYGVNIPAQLFASDINKEQPILSFQIQQQVTKWEPTLVLKNVTVQSISQEPGIDRINIDYSLSNNTQLTPIKTAVVLVGGTVIG
jgi:phage baseplate assembly protein W